MVRAVCSKGKDPHPILVDAVARAEKGQVDADLGGGVIKQRIARPGRGKSGGYRTIIFFRRGARAVFAYGFAKSDRTNIDADEEKQFKGGSTPRAAVDGKADRGASQERRFCGGEI